jgi:SAM-dependent methyltransferase
MRLHVPAVEGWCSAAVCLGYLSEKNGKVSLAPEVRDVVLNDQSPYYVAGQFAYSALRSLEYGAFGDLFASGKPKPPTSPETFEAIEEATSWDHQSFLHAVKTGNKKIHSLLSKGGRVLDVGCGAGKFMQRVKTAYPRSEFIGIDPYADDTKKTGEGITIRRGDVETMTFKEEFDLLYLGESLYIMQDKHQALRNCHDALRKGGTIAILEGLLTEVEGCRICEKEKMIMAMQLDFVLQGYPFMKKRQVLALLKECGFKNIKFTHLGVLFYLITADKPG